MRVEQRVGTYAGLEKRSADLSRAANRLEQAARMQSNAAADVSRFDGLKAVSLSRGRRKDR
jgi:hypothetical protein